MNGYLATPVGEGPWPGVVMIHEIFGLDASTRLHADRLAEAGYLTLAIDLFSGGGAARCLMMTMRTMLTGEGRAFDDIEAGRQSLIASSLCTGRVGVIGFCMGGGFALLSASRGFDAAAPNYGMLPRHLDDAMRDACPIVASFGGRDRTLANAAAKLDAALTGARIEHDVKEYPTAGHAFLNEIDAGPRSLRPLFRVMGVGSDPVAALDAWQRIEAFFGEHLH